MAALQEVVEIPKSALTPDLSPKTRGENNSALGFIPIAHHVLCIHYPRNIVLQVYIGDRLGNCENPVSNELQTISCAAFVSRTPAAFQRAVNGLGVAVPGGGFSGEEQRVALWLRQNRPRVG
jgi:hypothetical protein